MLRPGHAIAIVVVALLTLGVVMVNSAVMTVEARQPVTIAGILLSKSTVYMGLALLAMALVVCLPVLQLFPGSRDGDLAPPPPATGWTLLPLWLGAGILIAVCMSVYVPGIGRTVNGSHRWLRIGGQSIQPSEIAKWGLIALMAWYVWRARPLLPRFFTGLLPGLVAAAAVAGFVALEDLGTGVLLGLVAALVLLAGGARWWQFALMLPLGLLAFAALVIANPYRVKRLTAFLDPFADPLGINYHTIQSMVSIANGDVTGRGLGFSLNKFGYLPESETDFLFSIICEELGLPGAALVAALYVGLLWAGYLVIRAQTNLVLKLLATGIIGTVGIQAIVNMVVVTGLGPAKGIALPLLSSGGTGWILTAASLGLVIAMDRAAARSEARDPADLPGSSLYNVEPTGPAPREIELKPAVHVMPDAAGTLFASSGPPAPAGRA